MAIKNVQELRTAIQDHLERNDLAGQTDNFIQLAEARHRRDLRLREMLKRESVTVTGRSVSFPSQRLLEILDFRLLTDPVTVLTQMDYHDLNRFRSEESGTPKFFAIDVDIEFDRPVSETTTGELLFYEAFEPLSDDSPANKLLEIAPDAYLYGALAASAPFLMHDERVQTWNAFYSDARDRLTTRARQDRYMGPLVARVAGPTP